MMFFKKANEPVVEVPTVVIPDPRVDGWFVAGARPAAMWVGVASLFYSGVGVSLLNWLAVVFGLPMFPIIDPTAANNILMGLLGLGAARTAEKIKGVETRKIGK